MFLSVILHCNIIFGYTNLKNVTVSQNYASIYILGEVHVQTEVETLFSKSIFNPESGKSAFWDKSVIATFTWKLLVKRKKIFFLEREREKVGVGGEGRGMMMQRDRES